MIMVSFSFMHIDLDLKQLSSINPFQLEVALDSSLFQTKQKN